MNQNDDQRPVFVPQKRTWGRKLRDAIHGLRQSIRQQSSYRVHFLCAVLALLAAWYLEFDYLRFAFLTFVIFTVITTEMFNTALEMLAREVTDRESRYVAKALDISSGAVLSVALGAVLIGILLFVEALVSK
ncbi:MAG: diacylglycerol kinase family protein [Planctomycetia bacterium]|nr:diacylglycerol kinase family protein [Planctomycetia bacterium]